MSKSDNNQGKSEKLKTQIQLRIDLANKKLLGEIDLDMPLSLTKSRNWVNDDLGVESIGSPSSFTTTHKVHGAKVAELYNLLEKLKKPKKKTYTPDSVKYKKLKIEYDRLDEVLTNTANQFVAFQSQMDEMKEELDIIKTSEQGFIEEKQDMLKELVDYKKANNNLRLEIIKLREKLKRYEGKEESNITPIDFGSENNEK